MRFQVHVKPKLQRVKMPILDSTFCKTTVLLACMLSAAGLLTSAPYNSCALPGSENATVEQKLVQLEREWASAMMKNEPAAIERIEADDYTYVMDSMHGEKSTDLADAKSGAYTGSAELTEMKARVYGDAAVITGKASLRDAKFKGQDISGDYLFTDTFVRRDGRWQVVASHSSRLKSM